MPNLSLRTVGMSYLIDGLGASGLDPDRLREALTDRYGIALAVLRTPRSADPADEAADAGGVDALILDRGAEDRPALEDFLAGFARREGFGAASWDGGADPAVLRLDP